MHPFLPPLFVFFEKLVKPEKKYLVHLKNKIYRLAPRESEVLYFKEKKTKVSSRQNTGSCDLTVINILFKQKTIIKF